jgi:predicted ester cyclase
MSDSDKQVVRRIYDEVFSQGALDVVDEVVSPDAIDHSPPPFPVDDVREGLKEFTRLLRTAFPDVRVVINDMVAEDGKVAVYFTVQGTHEGDFMGIPATGARVSFECFDLIRVADGVCTEHWGVQDNAALMLQLGVGPPS